MGFQPVELREMMAFHGIADFITKLVAQERLDEVDGTALMAVVLDQMSLSVEQVEHVADKYRKIEFAMDAFRAVGYPYE